MPRLFFVCLLFLPMPVFAQNGERLFERCAACHSVTAPDGNVLVPGGRIGPDLYGIVGQSVAAEPGFNYSRSMREAAAEGLVWSEDAFVAYLRNPTEFLKGYLDDPSARGRMAFRLERGGDAIYRYLADLAR